MVKFFHFLNLAVVKVGLNLRSEAAGMRLSYAWWVLEPVLNMGAFYLVFGIFLNRGTEDFVTFLLCGLVPWLWFAKSTANSMNAIVQGKGLISQTYIPKTFFPLVIVCQDLVKQSFVLLLLLVYLSLAGYTAGFNWVWLFPIIFTQLLLTTGVSFLVAFLIPFIQDLKFLISTLLTMGMLGSGVFYSYKQVLLPEHRDLFLMNPMANLIANYRVVLMEGGVPEFSPLINVALGSMVLIVIGYYLMRLFDNSLTRQVVE